MDYKQAIYNNYISYHNSHISEAASLEKFRNHFPINDFYYQKHLPLNTNASILEIGCGDGNLIYWLNHKGFKNAAGIDISKEQVEKGVELGITGIHIADLSNYLESGQMFDMIIAKDVFEHFTRQEFFDTLTKIKKSLAKGGKLLIQVINGEGLYYTSHFYADITHEMAYTEKSLRQMVLAAGLNQVSVYAVNPFPKGAKGILRSIFWKIKVFDHKFWKAIEYGTGSGIFTSNIIAVIS